MTPFTYETNILYLRLWQWKNFLLSKEQNNDRDSARYVDNWSIIKKGYEWERYVLINDLDTLE